MQSSETTPMFTSSSSLSDECKQQKGESKGWSKAWSIDLFINQEIASNYLCNICNNVCERAVELSCDDHTENHDVLFCESCLCAHLSSNNNKCPINPNHLDADYNVARIVRKQINNLKVCCYNSSECEWNGTLNELSGHWKQCKHRIVDDDDTKCYVEQSIQKLTEIVKNVKNEMNKMKIEYNVKTTKKEIEYQTKYDSMQAEINEQNQKIDALSRKCEELMEKYECQSKIINDLTQRSNECSVIKSKKAALRRASSTRHFHPKGIELYHPKAIKYEMYHPKKAVEVWVSKTMGSMCKLWRFPCCGSAKEGSLYLVEANTNKKWDEPLYVVQKDNLPKYWHNDIHLGCKKNKKRNSKNMSYWMCCKGDIDSVGCKKRYKCCKREMGQSGCKVGWGC